MLAVHETWSSLDQVKIVTPCFHTRENKCSSYYSSPSSISQHQTSGFKAPALRYWKGSQRCIDVKLQDGHTEPEPDISIQKPTAELQHGHAEGNTRSRSIERELHQVLQSISLLAVNAVQCTVSDSRTCWEGVMASQMTGPFSFEGPNPPAKLRSSQGASCCAHMQEQSTSTRNNSYFWTQFS